MKNDYLFRFAKRFGAALLVGSAAMGIAAAQAPSEPLPPAVLPPTAEGDWVRTDPTGSGSFDHLTSHFKPASLTPEGTAMAARGGGRGGRGGFGGRGGPGGPGQGQNAADGPHPVGVPYVVRQNNCTFNGGQLGLEYDSEGFHMVMGKTEAVVVQERGGSRRIYLDGRALPTEKVRTPSSSGYSVGHVEADGTLVVETTDMTPGGVTAGGYRTPETKVIQRYIPSADGRRLRLVFEWIDPKIYQTPHTYEYTFDRMAAGSYALETYCDATDPLWGQSIVPPPQKNE